MAKLYFRVGWQRCPDCFREWNILHPSGVCITCVDEAIAREKKQIELGIYLRKTIGIYGIERYSFENFIKDDGNEEAFEAFKSFDNGSQNFFLYGSCGTGKALSLNTQLPTPDGWKTMGDIRIGDTLFDECGKRCNVTFATGIQLNRECFNVSFSDGTSIVADAEHQWLTVSSDERSRHLQPNIRTTQKIRETLITGRTRLTTHNHAISVSQPLSLPEKKLPIDPYILGVWLGDGDSARAYITCSEKELRDIIIAVGCPLKQAMCDGINGIRFSMGDGRGGPIEGKLQTKLRRLGLLKNKHIPKEYLRASLKQRLSLLQGLMDTDGHIDKRGRCEFSTVKLHIAEQVKELLISLGMKTTILIGDAKIYGRLVSKKYRLSFHPLMDVFRLPRKLARMRASPQIHCRNRFIVSVVPVKSVPVRCIQVDSKSELFLASESMIPTHNTHLSGAVLKKACAENNSVAWLQPLYVGRTLRSKFPSEEEEIIESWVGKDVCIVDDLGVGRDLDVTLRMIYELIDKRKARKRNGLIVVSNHSLDMLAKAYKDDRIISRIAGMCRVIKIQGPDRRFEERVSP